MYIRVRSLSENVHDPESLTMGFDTVKLYDFFVGVSERLEGDKEG